MDVLEGQHHSLGQRGGKALCRDLLQLRLPEPIVETMLGASLAVGQQSRLGGLDSWFDAATFTRFADTPSIGYGPRSIRWAHTIDEYVPVDGLVGCAQGLAVSAMRFCGLA